MSSTHQYDNGVYIGKALTNDECVCMDGDSFVELVECNKESKCIIGFIYLPFRFGNLFNGIIEPFLLSKNKDIYRSLEFIVYDDDNHIYFAPERYGPLINSIDDILEIDKEIIRSFEITVDSLNVDQTIIMYLLFDSSVIDENIQEKLLVLYIASPIALIAVVCIICIIFHINMIKIRKIVELQTMVSYVNHEIRNPLNILNGYVDISAIRLENMLKENQISNNECKMEIENIISDLKTTKNSNRLLLVIVNDILDIQKLELGTIELTKRNCSIGDLIDDLVKSLQHKIDEISANVNFSIELENPDMIIYTDVDRVIQILINFLTNAFKHTMSGEIKVVVKKWKDSKDGKDGKDILRFSIVDTGCGVKTEMRDRLFKDKFIGDNKTGFGLSGIGIGLYLCDKIVKVLGGVIGFESKLGSGSTFYIDIPISELNSGSNPVTV